MRESTFALTGFRAPLEEHKVRIDIDLSVVVAITDSREADGTVKIDGGGYTWTLRGLDDRAMDHLRTAWRMARHRR